MIKPCKSLNNVICSEGFLSILLFSLLNSYNWPAQTNGVDYADADEVRIYCIAKCKRWKIIEDASFSLSFISHRAIFATNRHSSFDSWDMLDDMEQGQKQEVLEEVTH